MYYRVGFAYKVRNCVCVGCFCPRNQSFIKVEMVSCGVMMNVRVRLTAERCDRTRSRR